MSASLSQHAMKSAMVDRLRPRRKPLKCENGTGSRKKSNLKNLSGNAVISMLFLIAERTLQKIMAVSQMDDMRYCPELSIVFFPKSGHFFWRFLHTTMKPFFNPTEKAVREIRCSVCGKVFVFRFWTAGFFYALQIEVR